MSRAVWSSTTRVSGAFLSSGTSRGATCVCVALLATAAPASLARDSSLGFSTGLDDLAMKVLSSSNLPASASSTTFWSSFELLPVISLVSISAILATCMRMFLAVFWESVKTTTPSTIMMKVITMVMVVRAST